MRPWVNHILVRDIKKSKAGSQDKVKGQVQPQSVSVGYGFMGKEEGSGRQYASFSLLK